LMRLSTRRVLSRSIRFPLFGGGLCAPLFGL
jgi:hypothetical protein